MIAFNQEDQDLLQRFAIEQFAHLEYQSAREAFELLFAHGRSKLPLVLTYAVCLSELGEGEQALATYELAKRAFSQIPESDRGTLIPSLFSSIEERLPGGKHSKGARNDLAGAAMKWLPKGSSE